MEEAVSHISRTPNHLMEAVARHSLAVDAQLAGESSEASAQFREAARIFSTLPSSPSRNALLFSAQVYQASLESEQGNNDRALEALHSARQNLSKQTPHFPQFCLDQKHEYVLDRYTFSLLFGQ